MLKIEHTKAEDGKASRLIVNDVIDYESVYYDTPYRTAYLSNDKIISDIFSNSVAKISTFLDNIRIGYEVDWWPSDIDVVCIFSNIYHRISYPAFTIELMVDIDSWAAGWSIKKFSEVLKSIIEDRDDENIKYFQDDDEFVSNGFGILIAISDLNVEVNPLFDEVFPKVEAIISDTNRYLASNMDNQSVMSFFNFPDSIKVPCQQYLMYFAQFLKDLGINVETEIREQAYFTLFKVTPNDKNEALDKIKEALEIYTNAPALNDLQFQNINNGDVAFMQLQANVMHLKSQIMFANTALQMKDATIEALQLSNYQLKTMVMASDEKSKQEEEIIPGVVSVKKYDGNWFSINLPEILSRLKRSFNK